MVSQPVAGRPAPPWKSCWSASWIPCPKRSDGSDGGDLSMKNNGSLAATNHEQTIGFAAETWFDIPKKPGEMDNTGDFTCKKHDFWYPKPPKQITLRIQNAMLWVLKQTKYSTTKNNGSFTNQSVDEKVSLLRRVQHHFKWWLDVIIERRVKFPNYSIYSVITECAHFALIDLMHVHHPVFAVTSHLLVCWTSRVCFDLSVVQHLFENRVLLIPRPQGLGKMLVEASATLAAEFKSLSSNWRSYIFKPFLWEAVPFNRWVDLRVFWPSPRGRYVSP